MRFDTAVKSYGFEQNVDEPCVYKRIINSTVASEHNIADPFTKVLPATVFEGHLKSLGLRVE